MFIVNNDRNIVVNADNVQDIYADRMNIAATTNAGQTVRLGHYKDDDRTAEVFDELLDAIGGAKPIVIQDIHTNKQIEDFFKEISSFGLSIADAPNERKPIVEQLDRTIYYMPKE